MKWVGVSWSRKENMLSRCGSEWSAQNERTTPTQMDAVSGHPGQREQSGRIGGRPCTDGCARRRSPSLSSTRPALRRDEIRATPRVGALHPPPKSNQRQVSEQLSGVAQGRGVAAGERGPTRGGAHGGGPTRGGAGRRRGPTRASFGSGSGGLGELGIGRTEVMEVGGQAWAGGGPAATHPRVWRSRWAGGGVAGGGAEARRRAVGRAG